MTTDLKDLLAVRAERAERVTQPADLDALLLAARSRAAERRRHLRTIAAGCVAALVLAGGTYALSASGGNEPTTHRSGPAAVAPGGSTPSITRTSVAPAPLRHGRDLQSIAPAPAAAPVSVGLVPQDWTVVEFNPAVTTYAPVSVSNHDPNHFGGKVTVQVGERYDAVSEYPITIKGRPARLDGTDDGIKIVTMVLPDEHGMHLDVTLQIPATAKITRDQALQIARTIDIRSTTPHSLG